MLKGLWVTHGLQDSMCMGPFEYHMHRPKRACGKEFLIPWKWFIVTCVDNRKVLSVIIGKVGYNFGLVMADTSLCGRKAPVGTAWSVAGGSADMSRYTAHDAIITQSFGHLV